MLVDIFVKQRKNLCCLTQ